MNAANVLVGRRIATLTRAVACAVVVGALASAAPLLAQPRGAFRDVRELPVGRAGERITELLEVLGANDPEAVARLVAEGFTPAFREIAPIEEHQAVFSGIYRRSHGFDFYGVREYEAETPASEHVVIVRNRLTEAWEAVVLHLETEPPHRIAGLQVTAARPPSDLTPPKPVSEAEIAGVLRSFVESLATAEAFSGTVLLAKNGAVLFQGAYGLASRRFEVPNRLDTRLNLGSMNKMFTAVAVLQLVQAGKVALDDPISSYLPAGWLSEEVASKIQVRHLLTHTSGLGSYFNEEYVRSSRQRFRELADYQPLIEGDEPEFEPGTGWRYSNTGMFLLGFVIEKASGKSYFDYVRDHVYGPAGMTDSDSYDMDRPVPNLAIGYSRDSDGWRNNLYQHVIRGGPAGGGFSTAPDLLRFARALREHRLLDREHSELLWSAKPELGSPDYGYGFALGGEPGARIVGHGGGFSGISSNLDLFLDAGFDAIVLSNLSGGADPVVRKMRELIAGLGS